MLKFKRISNIEQGMSNVEVLACVIYTALFFDIQCSFKTSIFDILCSIFVTPLNFSIQNSLFDIRYSLFKITTY